MTALAGPSPCRVARKAPRHTCSDEHAQMVTAYRDAREAAEVAREQATRGYATELSEYPPIITFKSWLRAHRKA